MYKKILAAVDGSDNGQAVLDTVASLAKLSGASVHVIHIRPDQVVAGGITAGVVVSTEEANEGTEVVEAALTRLRAEGIAAEGEVDEGLREELAAILVERAEALGSDLIAVGPGHYRGFSAFLHASVSNGVAKNAPVSVLLVRGRS
ncbi:universal stress protein [Actinacidiphila rubida]|uniref:Nucleotide-binding universal stress protein, UspA family n=1 Tax=Actinacidiphila rubida TaxID=310780 RepID=A0A1H8TLS2_9ACTN|nr:universal stress protein [Actinacidiphila rubida]SEO91771.1 Nucleotide-binding universal stress protein, UspA family [Actinacidiphila rubida]